VVQVRKNGLLVVAIGLQVVAPDEISTPTKAVRMRVGTEAGSSSSNKLRTINEKIVSMRGKRVPIGFGVSWNPVDGKDMLGHLGSIWRKYIHLGLNLGRNGTRLQLYSKTLKNSFTDRADVVTCSRDDVKVLKGRRQDLS
ncbi:hypothetical protein Tco_1468150, partial [Tanacetum coccineum]